MKGWVDGNSQESSFFECDRVSFATSKRQHVIQTVPYHCKQKKNNKVNKTLVRFKEYNKDTLQKAPQICKLSPFL